MTDSEEEARFPPDHIARECRKIQRTWSNRERERRMGCHRPIPFVVRPLAYCGGGDLMRQPPEREAMRSLVNGLHDDPYEKFYQMWRRKREAM